MIFAFSKLMKISTKSLKSKKWCKKIPSILEGKIYSNHKELHQMENGIKSINLTYIFS